MCKNNYISGSMDSTTIKWETVCGNNSLFWDSNRIFNSSTPVLSQCFQGSVLVWAPCLLYLLLAAPGYLIYYSQLRTVNKWRDKGGWQYCKLFCLVLLIALSLVELLIAILSYEDAALYQLISPAIRLITFIVALYMTHVEFSKGLHTSAPLFFLWFLLTVCGVFPFYTYILDPDITGIEPSALSMSLFYISYILILLEFVCNMFADVRALRHGEFGHHHHRNTEREHLLGAETKDTTEERPASPENWSSVLSMYTHTWITGLLIKGYKKVLCFDDLHDLMDKDKSQPIVDLAEEQWKKQHKTSDYKADISDSAARSFIWVLTRVNRKLLIESAVVRIILGIVEFGNPIILNYILVWMTSSDPFVWKGYSLAVAILVANVAAGLVAHWYYKITAVMGMRCRTAVVTAVYRKALRLSSAARKTSTVGEIVNLMSVDAQRIHDMCTNLHECWAAFAVIIVTLYLLWQQIGPSSLAGLALLILLAPFNGVYISWQYAKLQNKQMQQKDQRIKCLHEMFGGIKVLKMYAWEKSYDQKVDDIREKELKSVKDAAWLSALVGISWFCLPYLVSLTIFSTYILSSPDHYLDPAKAFVTLTLINYLNWEVATLPILITSGTQAYVSVKRIGKFLLQEEVDADAVNREYTADDTAASVEDGTFAWSSEQDVPTLRDINISIGRGKLVAVVGTVGSGKSSLVSAMLGEMVKFKGKVNVQGSVAYVSQQAWIQNMSLKNNVLFGLQLNEAHYTKVVEACALEPDFKILPGGDSTEIGEKGINLSGGQKQRVSLARAVYQNSDVYLMDDPLSAVDAHVGKHIFEEVIGPNGMLRNKTRVLVTHGITYLPQVDCIITLKEGEVSEVGTYTELLSRDGAFAEFIRTYLTERSSEEEEIKETEGIKQMIQRQVSTLSEEKPLSEKSSESGTTRRRRRLTSRHSHSTTAEILPEKPKPSSTLIEEETAEVGTIKLAVVKQYISAEGVGYVSLAIFSWLLNIGSQVGTNIWLSKWSDDPYINGTTGTEQSKFRLGVYAGVGCLQVIALFCLSVGVFYGGVKASRFLHKNLLHQVLRAPMSFFDTTPLGRIINRFSTDMDKVDNNIPLFTRFWTIQVATVIGVLIVVSYSTPIFLSVVLPLAILYYIIQTIYMTTVRQMKRIDSVRRSPIYVNFDETLVGVTCVRAFRKQEQFIAKNDRLTDDSQIAWYPILVAQRWLGVLLDTIGGAVVFFAAVFAIMQRDNISGGIAGLSISIAMQTTFAINMMVRGATELETHMVSLERIKEYSEVESEAPWEIEEHRASSEWPDRGEVALLDYATRYRKGLDLVLQGITFTANPAEKVGIVGRTGAGKSSMALSLFRIIEAAAGKIIIDGEDIARLGLHDLRQKLTIIPQDPVIFSGTLRENLDPFCVYNDEQLWTALEQAHLKRFVANLTDGLDYECGEGGEALSSGQRQLVCLARALLRHTKILILDEATAAVDMETDELIQNTIRTAFKDCTVLTVAHRLNTIMDYDRVMVLAEGKIVECDSPDRLLQNKASLFYGMAKDAGIVGN